MIDKDRQEELRNSIRNSPIYKAAEVSYQNGLAKFYGLADMAHYMFLEGYKFAKSGEMPGLVWNSQ